MADEEKKEAPKEEYKGTLAEFLSLPRDVDPTTLSKFISDMVEGFKLGAKVYGEEQHKDSDLFFEMRSELRDVACYAFFQYQEVAKLEQKYEDLKEEALKEKELFE